ncbi:MAG: hypothetical protein MUF51_10555, partial [Vicinamibacteria bacterium]|nr:hypothetical protein [Vicinamibacteria bacterium]
MMIRLGRPAALTLLMMALWSLYVWRLERSAIRLTPRGLGWSQIARGANADGVVRDVLVLQLPGLDRSEPRTIVMRRAPAQTASPGATLAIDGLAAGALRLANESVFSLPPAAVPGARVELRPMEKGQALTLTEIEIAPKRARSIRWLAALSLFGMLLIIAWRARRFAMAAVLSLSAVALWMISRVPLLTALSWPSALWVDATPLLVVTAASMLAYRMPAAERRHSMRIVGLGLLFAFGFWIRSAFLFSAGSWDTEYWKAWMLRAAEHGVAQVYGGPESVPPGEFWAQFTGHAPRFEARFHGRDFVVDYPPLA